ncbi:MAG: hypothetical protein JSR46_06490, partial [Verrucomicrobia bacterium]|nr:hypothetical protein [Verrucomicrobiota bacterium]
MKKFLRVAGWVVAIFLALLLITVASLPTLISCKSVNQFILSRVNRSIPGTVDILDLQASWFDGLRIEGVTYADAHRELYASCRNVLYSHSLFPLLLSPYSLGKVNIEDATIKKESAPEIKIADLTFELDIQKGQTAHAALSCNL